MSEAKKLIVYRSSAGSGKTYTLVRDYIALALATDYPGRFRQILAITFTNKAAEEMKERVLQQLTDLEENPNHNLMGFLTDQLGVNAETVQVRAGNALRFMLHNYAEVAISTIDKFMHQLVRAFSRDLTLNYDFEVETDRTPMLEEAVARMIEKVGTDDFLTNIMTDWVETQVENDRSWQIERNLVETGNRKFDAQGNQYLSILQDFPVDEFELLKKEIQSFNAAFENKLKGIADKVMQAIAEQNLTAEAFYYKKTGVFGFFQKIQDGDVLKDVNTYVHKSFEEDTFDNKNASEAEKAAIQSLSPLFHQSFREIEEIRNAQKSTYLLGKELFKNLHQLLLLNELHKSLEELKEERNLIFVDDFHTLIADVVKNEPAPFIYERTGQRFNHLMIDEFQDTSILQWSNFLPLVTDALSTGGKTLLVGDGKQAIYRWRGGEVEQFDRLPNIYPPVKDDLTREREQVLKRQYDPKNLEKNYRSMGAVVHFNNELYNHLQQHIPDSLRSVYDNAKQELTKPADAGLVTVQLVEYNLKDEGRELYINLIQEYIEECFNDGYHQRDICVITRSNKEGKEVVRALNGVNIGGEQLEFISYESLLIAGNDQVKLVVSALAHLSDPENLKFRLDFLIRLTDLLETEDDRHAKLEQYTRRGEKNALSEVLLEKYFHDLNVSWSRRDILQLNLYEMTEALARLLPLDGWSNPYWSFFKQQLLNFSSEQGNDLIAFLGWWDQKRDKLSLSIPDDSNAIRIMSIHKSKGLQFPVVIMPFADWNFTVNSSQYWAVTPPSLSEAYSSAVPKIMISGFSRALEETDLIDQIEMERSRNLLDNLNLLYVATTRAEERLYLLSRNQATKNRAANTAHWLTEYAASQNWESTPVRLGQQGHRSQYFKQKEESAEKKSSAVSLPVATNTGWLDKLKISYEAGQLIDGELQTTSRSMGNLVHRILAEIESPDDLEKSLERQISQGVINKEQSAAIAQQIEQLFKNPVARSWFEKHDKTLVEQAILTPIGDTARPDRVVIDGQQATVIDYKTGEPQPEHEIQIRQYGLLLEQMNYKSELYLCYLENNEVVKVSPEAQTSLF